MDNGSDIVPFHRVILQQVIAIGSHLHHSSQSKIRAWSSPKMLYCMTIMICILVKVATITLKIVATITEKCSCRRHCCEQGLKIYIYP